MINAQIPASIAANLDTNELELMAQVASQLGQPMRASDQALVDEAVRVHELGLTLGYR